VRPHRLVVVLLAAVGLAALVAGTLRGWWTIHPPAALRYEVWGIDVSHHQGAIDWPRVATVPRLHFAYLKATEGGDFTDPRFEENWREARRAGLRVGAYHFFSLCRPALDQARQFLAVVPRDPGALPPALDVELGGNCAARPPPEVVRREVATWLAEVERALGQRPVVYVTGESYDLYLRGEPFAYPLWVRDLLAEPSVDGWAMWQFWPRGRVAGIEGPVDLNALRDEAAARAR
jgi:lysozyme